MTTTTTDIDQLNARFEQAASEEPTTSVEEVEKLLAPEVTRKVTALGRIFGVGPVKVARWEETVGTGQSAFGAHLGLALTTRPKQKKKRVKTGQDPDFGFPVARADNAGLIGKHGGRQSLVAPAKEHRGSSKQVCGLWPWGVGANAPIVGTPIGSHIRTGAPVCYDAYNWFEHGGFISNPSTFIMSLPGKGKSTLARRMVTGKIAQGVTPLILGDLKPDYVDLIRALDGQVISVGPGAGKINPLDVGALGRIIPRLEKAGRDDLVEDVWAQVISRQVLVISSLIQIVRGGRVADFEETVLSSALRKLYSEDFVGGEKHSAVTFGPENPPILEDLIEVVIAGDDDMMLDAAADDMREYSETVKPLRRALRSIVRGPFGEVFNGHTDVRIDVDAPAVCMDVSSLGQDFSPLMAAVLLTCWSDGFGTVDAAHILEDAGLSDRKRNFMVVLDEMWRVLGAGVGLVDRVNALTRLNRTIGIELVEIVHTFKDLEALPSEEDRKKAIGFIERAGALIVGALPRDEMMRLANIKPFTSAEINMVSAWSSNTRAMTEAPRPGQKRAVPPGTGNFLIKVGESGTAGIPVHVTLTQTELNLGVHDTNQRFEK